MPISGSSSYTSTGNQFRAQWRIVNEALAPETLQVPLPDKTVVTYEQFEELCGQLQDQQWEVIDKLLDQQAARAQVDLLKPQLLARLNLFNATLDAYFSGTEFIHARPRVPSIGDGPEKFIRPLTDAKTLWKKLNDAPAPPGVTLPLVLPDGTDQAAWAAQIQELRDDYEAEQTAAQDVTIARGVRKKLERRLYAIMKAYRITVPSRLVAHPTLVETMPRLTPLPGHTPAAVLATAVFVPPGAAHVTHDPSNDPDLEEYQLRGTAGDKYDDDAVVLATHKPGDAREFVTTHGLSHPGAKLALKLFVILKTGNESGSATMVVERPAEELGKVA